MIKLYDSFTLFLYDFKLKKSFAELFLSKNESLSIWNRSAIKPDESYLFNHVQDFFTNNSNQGEIDENQCVIYELKKDNLSPQEKQKLSLFNNLFSKTHSMPDKSEDPSQEQLRKINFKLYNDSTVLSPKIFICPLSSVGIFTFVFRLSDESNTLENLINFNYKARIFSSGQIAYFNTAANPHPKAAVQEKLIAESLIQFSKKNKDSGLLPDTKNGGSITPEIISDHQWSMRTFVNYFLQDFEKGSIEEVSPARIQAFTYVQPEKKISGEELDHALFRLRRMYNYNYIPAKSFIEKSDETAQTFDQIHYGASVEGAVIMLNEDIGKLPAFLKNYSDVLKRRNIWTYLLAYHQRIALIVAADEVAALFGNNLTPDYIELSGIIKRLTTIQLKCMFNEISHYTQQNDFYYLCCKNLRLPNLFEELKEELSELNQTLAEEWHKQEEQARINKEKEDKARDQRITILVGLLVIPQVWLALIAMNLGSWQELIKSNEYIFIAFTILLGALLAFFTAKMFFKK